MPIIRNRMKLSFAIADLPEKEKWDSFLYVIDEFPRYPE